MSRLKEIFVFSGIGLIMGDFSYFCVMGDSILWGGMFKVLLAFIKALLWG